MLQLRICLVFFLGLQAAVALVVDGPALKEEGLRSFSAAVALIHNPEGRIASGLLLSGGHYVLTAAHVVASNSGESVKRGLIDFPDSRELVRVLGLPRDCSPLLVHRFEAGSNEGHFSAGDSGGPGVVFGPNGKSRVASLNLGSHRGTTDSDHRLNGSFGDLGISIDVSALLPWIQPILSRTR